jgi:hypothetical protein
LPPSVIPAFAGIDELANLTTGGVLSCGDGCDFDTSGCWAARFVDNADGTITDNVSGLMWENNLIRCGGRKLPTPNLLGQTEHLPIYKEITKSLSRRLPTGRTVDFSLFPISGSLSFERLSIFSDFPGSTPSPSRRGPG